MFLQLLHQRITLLLVFYSLLEVDSEQMTGSDFSFHPIQHFPGNKELTGTSTEAEGKHALEKPHQTIQKKSQFSMGDTFHKI